MTQIASNLDQALSRMCSRSAAAIVARARSCNTALNTVLLRRLAAAPGRADSLLAAPVFEAAKSWKPGDRKLGELAGELLDSLLVEALAGAKSYVLPKERPPYFHQLDAWRAALEQQKSVLVTSGTGSGKTECFLIPILHDILSRTSVGAGVQAILLYPLNALIDSQRQRLSEWAEGLGGRVKFALYNGDTPESARKAGHRSTKVELTNREDIRKAPPDILVTNITMLEYLLLRSKDRPILAASQGKLRWIVLDEAHSYVGSQAAEMALLLRRVRAAFGVAPEAVRLMATSATIGGEEDAAGKLADFTAALAGVPRDRVAVIEGQEDPAVLPVPTNVAWADPLPDLATLATLSPAELWRSLAPHPRIQKLHLALSAGPCRLDQAAQILFEDRARSAEAQAVLDALALAKFGERRLLPWRAHLFHRAQVGLYACVDPACNQRDPELAEPDSGWPFGALQDGPRQHCACGAPVFELVICGDCGEVHLQARCISGAQDQLELPEPAEGDDYALDAEPETAPDGDGVGEEDGAPIAAEVAQVLLAGPKAPGQKVWLEQATGIIHENDSPEGVKSWPVNLLRDVSERGCCEGAAHARLQEFRFGPAFFLGNALPQALEDLAAPGDSPGLPAGGRRAISFTDSRQGVARLAAKLQQEAERNLTRAFLLHAVQEGSGTPAPARLVEIETKIATLRSLGTEMFADQIEDLEAQRARASGTGGEPVAWPDLVARLAEQHELKTFAGEIWQGRRLGGKTIAASAELAQMFLFRELFRRPKVQNNPETMGLLQLVFPALDKATRSGTLPAPLRHAGIDAEGWRGLAYLAVDSVFRDNLAVTVPEWMVPLVSPRFGKLKAIVPADTPPADRDRNARAWPGPTWKTRPGRLQRAVYALIAGDPDNPQHQDLAADVLDKLWTTLRAAVLSQVAPGHYRLDFGKAAVARLDEAWLCPVTRRPFGYAVAGRSPYDPGRPMERISFPHLPLAQAIGLTAGQRATLEQWCTTDLQVAALRRRGLWSDMTDRVNLYPAFLRAQEHSAQIPRAVLQRYEQAFNAGRINLLNCSTTMEMGVDLAAVQLVVNANVPPALSNYRQRIGRAGRRGEPWAFGLTFCRDLPLDRMAFLDPVSFLLRRIAAPRVWLDSVALVQRHVNAALLGQWLAEQGGMDIKASTGAFLGLPAPASETVPAPAYQFLEALGGAWGRAPARAQALAALVHGSALEGQPAEALVGQTAAALERLATRWHQDYAQVLDRAVGAEEDAAKAFELRARRMAGEFLLGDLARRGFTPAYGFPTDVVSFDPLVSGRTEIDDSATTISFDSPSGATRELHQALREYAPGSEIVIDGLVYRSAGVLPAWGADKDASRLEDFQDLWDCTTCHAFGVSASGLPATCPACGGITLEGRKILRPAGFLGDRQPHTGYEALARVPFQPPRVSAQGGDWAALPDPATGRTRHDPAGLVATRSSGLHGGGFALCLDCGRAAPMQPDLQGIAAVLPGEMAPHRPLARSPGTRRTPDGFCPGGYTAPHRVQRHVHLAQVTRTNVFELQLPVPAGKARGQAKGLMLAVAAALREGLCARLGIEVAEIGLAAGPSIGADQGTRISAWLLDRAAGGAGLVARLQEPETFAAVLDQAARQLDCPEGCAHGCPSCILHPDLSLQDIRLDRPGALALVQELLARHRIPPELQFFGPQTRSLGGSLVGTLDRARRVGMLSRVQLVLHGTPDNWDLQGWNVRLLLAALAKDGVATEIVMQKAAVTHAGFDLSARLALFRLAQQARIRLADALPFAIGTPILALVEDVQGHWRGYAAQAADEAQISAEWATGASGAIFSGPIEAPAAQSVLSLEKLFEYGSGNGRILTPKGELDGPARGFGKRFWGWIGTKALLEVQAMRQFGVTEVRYRDRYLLTPITLLSLAETIRAMPGISADPAATRIRVDLAPNADRKGAPDYPKIFHGYADDELRRETLGWLLPGASVTMARHRNDLPHRREMLVTLADGRVFRLLFDQGFGALRASGPDERHDFHLSPEQQANRLTNARIELATGDEPVILETMA